MKAERLLWYAIIPSSRFQPMLRIVTCIDNFPRYQFALEHQERDEISSERDGVPIENAIRDEVL
jgi:hypothetical protein